MYFHCHVYTVYTYSHIYIWYISILIGIRNHGGMTIAHFDWGRAAPLGMKRVVEVIRSSGRRSKAGWWCDEGIQPQFIDDEGTMHHNDPKCPLLWSKKQISLGCTTLYNLYLIVRGTFFFRIGIGWDPHHYVGSIPLAREGVRFRLQQDAKCLEGVRYT